MRVQRPDVDAVRRMIERYRLQGFLEIVAEICGTMAREARDGWKDEASAQSWEHDAMTIDQTRESVLN
jgi:hypothetical protein